MATLKVRSGPGAFRCCSWAVGTSVAVPHDRFEAVLTDAAKRPYGCYRFLSSLKYESEKLNVVRM